MTRNNVNIATLYSSAQCVLSVVGSVGVILLFAGIPQLIYSPTVSVANLMTFLLGAILITTMVAGNSFLNYKYRKFSRAARHNQRDVNSTEAAATASRVEADDKPPSYEAILSSDGLPPDYFSILSEKPPKYEDLPSDICTSGSFTPAVPLDPATNPCRSDSGSPISVELTTPPSVVQPKGIATEAETSSPAAPSRAKKEDETSELTTSQVPTQVTIGYDNEAYSPEAAAASTPAGGSPSEDLRESES